MSADTTPIRAEDRLQAALDAIAAGPSEDDLAQAPLLENWISERGLHRCLILTGIACGHPSLPNGQLWTSPVVGIAEDRSWLRTLSRWYRLGSAMSAADPKDYARRIAKPSFRGPYPDEEIDKRIAGNLAQLATEAAAR